MASSTPAGAGPLSNEGASTLRRKARDVIVGGSLNTLTYPPDQLPIFAYGRGADLYDVTGRRYVDFVMGSGPLILGHAPPAVLLATRRQIELGTTYHALSMPAIELATELVAAVPSAEIVRFQTTGSEAVAAATRLAKAATGRQTILRFAGAFHGGSDLGQYSSSDASALSPFTVQRSTAGLSDGFAGEVLMAPYGDREAVERIFVDHHQSLAAILVEPVQRAAPPDADFLATLRALADRYGIVLIFDEIVTGFRLGYGGAQAIYGTVPDLTCLGKIIGGGFVLSAVTGPRRIMDLADPARGREGQAFAFLSGTLAGNPVAASAGLAVLAELRVAGFYERLHACAASAAEVLANAAAEAGASVQISRVGSIIGLYFGTADNEITPLTAARSDKRQAHRFAVAMLERGVYVAPAAKLYVSGAHSEEHVEILAEAARFAFRASAGSNVH